MIKVGGSLLKSDPGGYSYEPRKQTTDLGESVGQTGPNEEVNSLEQEGLSFIQPGIFKMF